MITPRGQKIPGNRLRSAKGKKGRGTRGQKQAHGAGHRDERRRLAVGGGGKGPGGQSFTLGEEVGSGFKREVIRQQTATDG